MGSSKLGGGGGNWIFQFYYSSQCQLVLLLRRCFYHFLSEQYLLAEPLSTTSNEELFLKNLNLSTIDHNKLRINFGSLTQFNFLLWNRCTLIPEDTVLELKNSMMAYRKIEKIRNFEWWPTTVEECWVDCSWLITIFVVSGDLGAKKQRNRNSWS